MRLRHLLFEAVTNLPFTLVMYPSVVVLLIGVCGLHSRGEERQAKYLAPLIIISIYKNPYEHLCAVVPGSCSGKNTTCFNSLFNSCYCS